MAQASHKSSSSTVVRLPNVNDRKLFVLDTSVLVHDPESLFRFQEHDIYFPRQVLAQLDRLKIGHTDVARNARQVTRTLDVIFNADPKRMRDGVSLAEVSNAAASGKLFFQMEQLNFTLPKDLIGDEADRRIISVACKLRENRREYTDVVLVSKDANMRYAALAAAQGNKGVIKAEDYLKDKVLLKDSDILPTGYNKLPPGFWDDFEKVDSGKRGSHDFWKVRGPLCRELSVNEFVYLEDGSLYAQVKEQSGDTMTLERITDYRSSKHDVWGVHARNIEQNFALNCLMDPEIDLVILLGDAGTGKSISALASGLTHLSRGMTSDNQGISKIIVTRAMVPVGGEEIGYLPGDVKEKFGPWMMALEDTQDALFANAAKQKRWEEAQIEKWKKSISIQPIGMIAGRTLANSYVIVDEAQNLTPYQAKMLVTRAGDGAKFVFCGNLSQIDTPFLDERSSGLAYLVMRMKGDRRVAFVILQECVRSRLAKLGVERL